MIRAVAPPSRTYWCESRMPRLPPVEKSPHARLRFTLWPGVGYSVFTFDQSHSSSSATICARPVSVPCPISERAMRMTTVSSGRMTTHAVTSGEPSCARTTLGPNGIFRPMASPAPSAVLPMTKERGDGHDHSGLAIAALRDLVVEPGLLHLVQHAAVGEAFDRGDLLPLGGGDGHDAGAHRRAVDVHGARPALGDAAAVLRAGEADLLADCPQQGRVRVHRDVVRFSVDRQSGHRCPSRLAVLWNI